MTFGAVRTDRGRLHVARLEGRRWVTACHRTLSARAAAVVYQGREADRAWEHELQCVDCASLTRRGPRELARVAGWLPAR